MIAAGINHHCAFGKEVMDEFLKGNWPDSQHWNTPDYRKKLWNGELKEFQLGKSAMLAMKCSRNTFTSRVVATTGT